MENHGKITIRIPAVPHSAISTVCMHGLNQMPANSTLDCGSIFQSANSRHSRFKAEFVAFCPSVSISIITQDIPVYSYSIYISIEVRDRCSPNSL